MIVSLSRFHQDFFVAISLGIVAVIKFARRGIGVGSTDFSHKLVDQFWRVEQGNYGGDALPVRIWLIPNCAKTDDLEEVHAVLKLIEGVRCI